jgi:hypothetical protein
MDNLTKNLNKWLGDNKSLLYNEYKKLSDTQPLIDELIKAVNMKYTFTQKQISQFIRQSTYTVDCGDKFLLSTDDNHKTIIKYIFTNYNFTQKEISNIFEKIYKYKVGDFQSYVIDCLFEIHYNFDNEFLWRLKHGKYHNFDIQHYDTLHKNVIFIAYSSLLKDRKDIFYKCIKIIKNSTEPFDQAYFKLIPCLMSYDITNVHLRDNKLDIFLDALFMNCSNEEFSKIFENTKDLKNMHPKIINYMINKFGYSDLFVKELIIGNYDIDYIFKLIDNGHKLTIEHMHILLEDDDRFTPLNNKRYKYRRNGSTNNEETFIKVITSFKKCGVIPDVEILNVTCRKGYINIANSIMSEYNILPDKYTLDLSVMSLNCDLIAKVLNYKIIPDDATFYKIVNDHYDDGIVKNIISIVELFIIHGFVIKFEHIDYLLLQKAYLLNLERFGIEYDEKLYFSCFLNDCHPVEYTSKYDPLRMKLYELCRAKRTTFDKLKKFLDENDIKLDMYALDYIVSDKKYLGIQVMKQLKCELSLITVYKKCFASNATLRDVVAKYGISGDNMRVCCEGVL